jgi:hypothetical protein
MLTKAKKHLRLVSTERSFNSDNHITHAQGERKQQQNRFYFHQNPDTELKPRETSTLGNTPNSTLAADLLLCSELRIDRKI